MNSDRNGPAIWIGVGLLALFFGLFLIYPVGLVLNRAFFEDGRFTLAHFGMLLESPLLRKSFVNSLGLALLTTLVVSAIGLPVAYLLTRFEFRGKVVLGGVLLLPMVLPPFVGAIGLKQLFAQFGSVNLLLMKLGVLGPDEPIDWFGQGGFAGMVALQVLNLHPILYLNLAAAMANVDPSLAEAARNLGASSWRVFRTVTLPLIMPGYFAGAILVFIWAFTDLGTPLIFGVSRTVPVQLFDALSELNSNPQGYALVVVVLVLSLTLFGLSRRWLGGKRYEMFARGQVQGAVVPLRGMKLGFVWFFLGGFALLSILPHAAVCLQSFSGEWVMTIAPTSWTTSHYSEVFGHGLTASSIRKSLFFSGFSALLDLVLGVAIAWMLTRRKIPGAWLLDGLAMLPLALPGLVVAFGYVAGFDIDDKKHPWLNAWVDPRENPTLLLIIGYAVRRLPYIVRTAYAGFQQTSVTLEEASANLGAGPWRTLRRITLPLILANLIAGTVLTFAFAMLEVSDSLILAMKEQYFPITKMIWLLMGRIDPAAANIACALGVVGMLILGGSLLLAARLLGRRMGQLFRS